MVLKQASILALTWVVIGSNNPAYSRVETFFNHNVNTSYFDSFKNIQRSGDDLENVIISEMKKAQKSIFVAIQELRLPKIAKLLKEKANSGVDVRVVLENNYNYNVIELKSRLLQISVSHEDDVYEISRYEELLRMIDTNLDGKITQAELEINDAIEILRTSKVKISDDSSDDSEGSGLMHHKFVIVDNKITVITSANFTPSCIHGDISSKSSRGNANSMMVVESPEFSKLFTEEFKQLWARKFGLNKKYRPMKMVSVDGINIKVKFSPTSLSGHYTKTTNGLIVSELKKAKEKIEAALFVFSEQQIANAMDDNSFHPEVSVMVENKFAFRYYSELLDLFGVQRKAPEGGYEINNRPWKKPLEFGGAVKLDKGDVMHHKFAVLDNKKVIMGSHNWSESANTQNDEFLVVIEDIQTASRFSQEFARMKNYASPKVPETN